ncbi:MAG: antibiotic biosynthesis monooxygenase [Pseudomonadota bacterium]
MIAVIFEVVLDEKNKAVYFKAAEHLKSELFQIKGFISIERFQSVKNSNKLLSLSFWENEEAIYQWREQEQHRNAQELGRARLFQDYRLRVAQVIRDYGKEDRDEAPQ